MIAMDFNATIDLIIRELEEAREIIDDLKKFPGSPVLQIELAKSKCKNAADVIALIKEYRKIESSSTRQPEPLVKEETKKAVLQEIESKIREIDVDQPEPIEPERPVVAEIEEPRATILPHESKSKDRKNEQQETLELENDESIESDAPEKEAPEPKKSFVAPIIADTFSHLANRFGETDDDYAYSHGRKLSDLSEAIGINDRFYYIREIFDGNRDAYSQAITKIEKALSLDEARSVLLSSKSSKADQQAVKQFLDLVRRKFQGNE